MRMVGKYGEKWPRNLDNIKSVETECEDPEGVYILYDGSMPLYIGKGKIHARVKDHTRGTKARYWDYFSWYEIKDEKLRHEVESILLRLLPFYLRSLNKYRGKLSRSGKRGVVNPQPDIIKKDNRPPHRKKRK